MINDFQNLDLKALFELIKYKFKCFARVISLENVKNYRKEEKELTEKNKNVEDRALESEAEEYKMTKIKLENIIEIRIKGQILRSKANFYEYGERSSKFFLNLEKKRAEACWLQNSNKRYPPLFTLIKQLMFLNVILGSLLDL